MIRRNISSKLERRKVNGKIKTKDVPILVVVTYEKHRLKLPTGLVIDAEKWDNENGRVRRKFSNSRGQTHSQINSYLSTYETAVNNLFLTCEISKKIPTTDEVKAALKTVRGKNKKAKAKSFFDVYDDFVAQRSRVNEWVEGTIGKFKTIKSHLMEFDPKLTFHSANKPETLGKFVEDQKKKGLRNTTIAKNLRFVKSFLKWAYDKGISQSNDYRKYTPNLKGTDGRNKTIIFLTPDEFTHLYNFDCEKGYLERVRDVFCFCCATGVRYSDAFNLKKTDVKNDHIEFTTVKTGTTLKVELNDYSRAILMKYVDVPFPENKALPVISNQKMNKYLKELCQLAEINEPVTITYQQGNETKTETYPKHELIGTHTGRRTFVCLCLYRGIAPTTIMKWTGHTSYETLKPYVDVMDGLKKAEMRKFKF